MRKRRCALASLAIAAVASMGASAADSDDRAGPTLTRLARIAELYRDSALQFSCEEEIAYHGERSGRIQFSYLFVHDEQGRFRDYRTWRAGTAAAARGDEVDPVRYRVPRFLQSAYLWVFIFRSDRQPNHEFFDLGDGFALERPALKIGFQPTGAIIKGRNDWAGIAWIDRDTSQILKVEAWSPDDWNLKVRRELDLREAPNHEPTWESGPYDIESIVTEFSVDRNGMRFPGRVTISRVESTVLGGVRERPTRERETLHVTQDYSHYEFFSVRTREEIARFVGGEGALP